VGSLAHLSVTITQARSDKHLKRRSTAWFVALQQINANSRQHKLQ
jgi:hypothetical protein